MQWQQAGMELDGAVGRDFAQGLRDELGDEVEREAAPDEELRPAP